MKLLVLLVFGSPSAYTRICCNTVYENEWKRKGNREIRLVDKISANPSDHRPLMINVESIVQLDLNKKTTDRYSIF